MARQSEDLHVQGNEPSCLPNQVRAPRDFRWARERQPVESGIGSLYRIWLHVRHSGINHQPGKALAL